MSQASMSEEPILRENKDRFVLFPIRHHDVWKFYKQAEASFWTAEEIDLSQDLRDWESLNDGERHFITHVLAFTDLAIFRQYPASLTHEPYRRAVNRELARGLEQNCIIQFHGWSKLVIKKAGFHQKPAFCNTCGSD